MNDEDILRLIKAEFIEKTLGVTRQYLEIHQPVYENGGPRIDRIDREKEPDCVTAYLPVEDEYFFFAVYIDPIKKEIYSIGTESRNWITFRATSESLSAKELMSFVKFSPTRSWNNGDLKKNGRVKHKCSAIEYTPNPEPDEFEDKLPKLLVELQKDKDGILALTKQPDVSAYIQIIMDFHHGNQLLGSATIDSECIKMINELNLEISFDFTAWGVPFK